MATPLPTIDRARSAGRIERDIETLADRLGHVQVPGLADDGDQRRVGVEQRPDGQAGPEFAREVLRRPAGHARLVHCSFGPRREDGRGKPFVEMLLPEDDDYFVLKPKHSGFYSTTLSLLLTHLTAENLILTGIAGNNCVLFTANDAYMRDFKLFIPADCVVSNTEEENEHALKQMETVLKADTTIAADLDLQKISG